MIIPLGSWSHCSVPTYNMYWYKKRSSFARIENRDRDNRDCPFFPKIAQNIDIGETVRNNTFNFNLFVIKENLTRPPPFMFQPLNLPKRTPSYSMTETTLQTNDQKLRHDAPRNAKTGIYHCSPFIANASHKTAHVNPLEPRRLGYGSLLPRPRPFLVEVARFEDHRVHSAFYAWMMEK